MLSYEEAGYILDDLTDALPEEIFRNLNGGISFVEEAQKSEDGRYVLGTYFRNGMGRYIELYYGSFVELYGDMDDELFRRRLQKTLHHELTHHIESQAGDRSLERWDERQSELCGFGGIDVKSVLFVCDDNTLSLIAEAVFNANKAAVCPYVSCCSAGLKQAEQIDPRAEKYCRGCDISLPNRRPAVVDSTLVENNDVVLCMTAQQADEPAGAYQELDERIMCLAEDDITPPLLPMGWKKCIERIEDEVLAVIDELGQEEY